MHKIEIVISVSRPYTDFYIMRWETLVGEPTSLDGYTYEYQIVKYGGDGPSATVQSLVVPPGVWRDALAAVSGR